MANEFLGATFTRRRFVGGAASLGLGALAGSAAFSSGAFAAAPPKPRTVEDGFITIAMSGAMPNTGMKNGAPVGTDVDMVTAIAKRLGLGIKPAVMAWSATIEAVKTGRADLMCGDMGWSKARANALLLTDAIYYDANYVTMKKDHPSEAYFNVADLAGHRIGSGTGYDYVPDLKKVPNSEVKLYDNEDGCLRDLEAGRIDYAVLDGTTIAYILLQNPGIGLKLVPIEPNAQYPALSGKGRTVMGMGLDNPDLFDAVNAGVKWLWSSKTNAACLARYGLDNPDYMVKATTDPRIGVDRTAEGAIIGPGAHQAKDFSSYFA